MKLNVWLQKHNIMQKIAADDLGISRSLFSDIAKERRRPTPEMAKLIEDYTHGEVNRLELLYPQEDFGAIAKGTPLTHEYRKKLFDKIESLGQPDASE